MSATPSGNPFFTSWGFLSPIELMATTYLFVMNPKQSGVTDMSKDSIRETFANLNNLQLLSINEIAAKIVEIKKQRETDVDLYGPADPNDGNGKLITVYSTFESAVNSISDVISQIDCVKQFAFDIDQLILQHPEILNIIKKV